MKAPARIPSKSAAIAQFPSRKTDTSAELARARDSLSRTLDAFGEMSPLLSLAKVSAQAMRTLGRVRVKADNNPAFSAQMKEADRLWSAVEIAEGMEALAEVLGVIQLGFDSVQGDLSSALDATDIRPAPTTAYPGA